MNTTLMPVQRFGMFEPFRKEMDTLFERFFGDEAAAANTALVGPAWSPRIDVEETEKDFVVKADIPGVDPKAVEISVQDNVLTVRGEKKEEKEEKKKDFRRVERFTGSFYRAIVMPPGADVEKITAASANGVVTITVPKKPEVQAKKIAVTAKG